MFTLDSDTSLHYAALERESPRRTTGLSGGDLESCLKAPDGLDGSDGAP
jgi:hypothetical protein